MGGEGGYWFDARPRRRKVFRQADRGQDRQREENWLDGRGDFSYHRSRFRYATREGRYSRERSRDASSWGRSFSSRSRHHSREGRALARRRNGGSHSRPRSFRKEGETRAAGGGRLAVVGPSQRELEKAAVLKVAAAESSLKRLVTFYFTNFPLQAPNFILRQGFEVCGMLEEVFVPNKLNMYGAAYGFVRFSNVRDVDKLLRAVNNVYFGHMRVKASLARFHKTSSITKADEAAGKAVRASARVRPVGNVTVLRYDGAKGGNFVRVQSGVDKEAVGPKEHVGPILEKVTEFDQRAKVARKGWVANEEGTCANMTAGEGSGRQQNLQSDTANQQLQRLVRKYRSSDRDLNWARKGLIGTVRNGEAIPVIQNIVEDAGFRDVDIIPLGADKVFIHSLS